MDHKAFKKMLLNILATETTDWVIALTAIGQLIVTTVGFILLYVTFALQAKVSMDQQKMLEIESRRVRREIRPSFNTELPMQKSINGSNTIRFLCESNNAYNVHVVSLSGPKISTDLNGKPYKCIAAKEAFELTYTFTDNKDPTDEERNKPDYSIRVELHYEDADGQEYKQVLSGVDGNVNAERPIVLW